MNLPEEKDFLFAQETEELYDEILSQDIQWHKYSGNQLEKKEAGMLLDYCKSSREEQALFFSEQGLEYAGVFIKALNRIPDQDPKQYLIALISDMLEHDLKRAHYFHQISNKNKINLYAPFFNFIEQDYQDPFGVGRAAHCLALLFHGQSKRHRDEMDHFFRWLLDQIKNKSSGHSRRDAVIALKNLLKDCDARSIFVEYVNGGLVTLIGLLHDRSDVQLLYLVVYCIWLLSFKKELHNSLHETKGPHQTTVVIEFSEICKTVNREKVVRVCLATFVNLIDEGMFDEDMIGAGLPKVLQSLTTRKWKDVDLKDDLEKLDQKLDDKIMELSSYEMYQAEVNSGKLRWGPVHTEQFWRENHPKFDQHGFDLIPKLINLLQHEEQEVVEVACYDLGEFARFHPDGKKQINLKQGKKWLMARMNHNNEEVQKQALLAVQKLMIKNWESLQSTGGVSSLTGNK